VSGNRYQLNDLTGLTASELFFWIVVDETCKHFGIDDVAAVVAILTGRPNMPTRGKLAGAIEGTSRASIISRKYITADIKYRVLPTIVGKDLRSLKILLTKNLGTFVGRTVPIVGWVFLLYDAVTILAHSIRRYNYMVLPEDKVY